jgi:hypothetical protein
MVLRVRAAWAGPLLLGVHRSRATGLVRHPHGSSRRQRSRARGAAPGGQHSPAGDQHGTAIIWLEAAA